MMLELLELPAGMTTREGAGLSSYQRVPLPLEGLVIGGPGSELLVPDVRDGACRIASAHGQARITHLRRVSSQLGPGGLIYLTIDGRHLSMRVLADDAISPAWPALAACKAIEAAAANVSSLDVLADALLEQGHPLGQRLRNGSSTAEEDQQWLAHFSALLTSGELQLSWHRAVAQHAVVRGGHGSLATFAGHALLHLVQRLDVIPWSESSHSGGQQVLDLLAEGTLPWLEDLRVYHLSSRELHALERDFRSQPNWRRAFPRVRAPTLLRRERLGVETAGKIEEVGERGVQLDAVPDTGPIPTVWHWVREFQGAVMLGTSSRELLFNGRALQRPAGNMSTWTILLVAGDEFFLEGKARRIVSLGPQR